MARSSFTEELKKAYEISLPDMLDARERRSNRQSELRAAHPGCTMVCFTMNIAGPIKNTPLIRRGFLHGCALFRQQLMRLRKKAVHEVLWDEPTGNEGYFMVDLPAARVKRLTVEIEDRDPVGRLFDMDVLDADGRKLDREELGLSGRTCLLCDLPAKVCSRSRTHTVAQLQERTWEMLAEFVREHDLTVIARDACRALLYEVCTTPKPGLVDRANSGSHRDMDIFTFMDSAAALQPYFRRCAEIGMDFRRCGETGMSSPNTGQPSKNDTGMVRLLREAGAAAERDMLSVTGGVNTHKGAIFSMGIACAALGRTDHSRWSDPEAVLAECGRIATALAGDDFAKLDRMIESQGKDSLAESSLTVGEKLYLQYGIRGVRGQAMDGFPAVLHAGLPVLERELAAGADLNRAGSVAMLAILCADTDTNLIARGGLQTALAVTGQVTDLLEKTPSPAEAVISALDRQFIEDDLSPGGSADLLGLCYLLHFMKQEGSTWLNM